MEKKSGRLIETPIWRTWIMKKILYITYYWPPSGGAGVQRSLKFVKYLGEFAVEAFVLTVDPKYASYPILDPSLENEINPEIKVSKTSSFEPLRLFSAISGKNKIPHGGFSNTSKDGAFTKIFKFIRGNFFIPDARRGWVRYAVRKAVEIIKLNDIDLVVISSPPHSSQLIGLKLKKLLPNCKWIADLRDPWTDIYYYKDLMHTLPSRQLDLKYERLVLENCDAAIVVSDEIKKLYTSKSSQIDPDKFVVIPNGFDSSDFEQGIVPEQDCFCITYVGTIADNYDPEIFFEAFHFLVNEFPKHKLRLRFVGSISAKIEELIRFHKLEGKIELIPHTSHKEAIRYMQKASLLLLIIPAVANDKGILTGKLFEYIGSGRPIVAIGPSNGDAAKILEKSNCGRIFNRSELEALKEHLRIMLNSWSNDYKFDFVFYTKVDYSRRKLSSDLADLIQRI